eukprot:g27418.t1
MEKADGKDSEKDSEKESGEDSAVTGDEKEKKKEGEEAPKEKPKEDQVDMPEVDLGTMDRCDMIRAWVRKSLKAWEKDRPWSDDDLRHWLPIAMPSVCTFRGVEPCMMTPVKLHRCSTCGWPCWMCVQCLNARWCPRCGRCLGDCFSDVEEELLEELRMEYFRSELAELPDEQKKTAATKAAVAAHRQVRRDVRPLQKRLRMYRMEEWLLDKIYNIVKKADDREYREAAEAYLDLTIGKAAWPVGIGCGGSMLMEEPS